MFGSVIVLTGEQEGADLVGDLCVAQSLRGGHVGGQVGPHWMIARSD